MPLTARSSSSGSLTSLDPSPPPSTGPSPERTGSSRAKAGTGASRGRASSPLSTDRSESSLSSDGEKEGEVEEQEEQKSLEAVLASEEDEDYQGNDGRRTDRPFVSPSSKLLKGKRERKARPAAAIRRPQKSPSKSQLPFNSSSRAGTTSSKTSAGQQHIPLSTRRKNYSFSAAPQSSAVAVSVTSSYDVTNSVDNSGEGNPGRQSSISRKRTSIIPGQMWEWALPKAPQTRKGKSRANAGGPSNHVGSVRAPNAGEEGDITPAAVVQPLEVSTLLDSMILVDDIGFAVNWISPVPVKVNGRFCDVFEGSHVKVGKVALKRPRIDSRGYDQVLVRRFEREAATWRRLSHPHILEFLGTIKRDGHIYFVSPFIGNGTLVEYITERPDVNRIRLLRETADAVQYLHQEAVVHGDLKAGNILINNSGHSLLCDFGLTRTIESRTSTAMRGAGTFRWQSPELWNNVPKSFESDVYAFGMTIAEVLTGEVPFHDLINDVAVMHAVILRDERPPRTPAESSSGISYETMWDVANACWPRTPSDRISMSEAFQRILMDPSLASAH